MMLEDIAYLAQIVGVAGLAASLVYVGKQLQLYREQLKADAEGRYYTWVDQAFSRIALDREFAEVWNKGNALHELDEVDRERLVNHEIGALYMWLPLDDGARDATEPFQGSSRMGAEEYRQPASDAGGLEGRETRVCAVVSGTVVAIP